MDTPKKFASQADLDEKKVTFAQLSEHAWAYTAEGDPNTGIVIGDDAVLVADTQATPAMAQDVIRRIREVTDKPISYVVLTHYHAVRVLGASAYGAQQRAADFDALDAALRTLVGGVFKVELRGHGGMRPESPCRYRSF